MLFTLTVNSLAGRIRHFLSQWPPNKRHATLPGGSEGKGGQGGGGVTMKTHATKLQRSCVIVSPLTASIGLGYFFWALLNVPVLVCF